MEELRWRRIGEIAVIVELEHIFEREVTARHFCRLVGLKRLFTDAQHRQASGHHETLLRSGNRKIDAPLVHAKINRRNRGYAVDIEHCRVVRSVQNLTHARDIRGHARRGFVLRCEDGADFVALIGLQNFRVILKRHALAPFDINHRHVEAEALCHIAPEVAELAKAGHQNLVADIQRVRDGGFPCART